MRSGFPWESVRAWNYSMILVGSEGFAKSQVFVFVLSSYEKSEYRLLLFILLQNKQYFNALNQPVQTNRGSS